MIAIPIAADAQQVKFGLGKQMINTLQFAIDLRHNVRAPVTGTEMEFLLDELQGQRTFFIRVPDLRKHPENTSRYPFC